MEFRNVKELRNVVRVSRILGVTSEDACKEGSRINGVKRGSYK
jgi:hypothetical protein